MNLYKKNKNNPNPALNIKNIPIFLDVDSYSADDAVLLASSQSSLIFLLESTNSST
jgi:hypothetical protein